MKNKIKNKAELEVRLCGRKHVVESIETTVEPIKIDIEQEQPCRFVLEDDKYKYVFKVKNQSHTDICDVKFKDYLSDKVTYVHGSFEVNGYKEHAKHYEDVVEYMFRELGACQTVTVSFDVKVKPVEHGCGHHKESTCIHAGEI